MSVEARTGGGQPLTDVISLATEEARQGLVRIVNPPYNTPDGKPLKVHFFQPGEAKLFNRQETQAIIRMLEDS